MSADTPPDKEYANPIWVSGDNFKTDDFRCNLLLFVKRHNFTLTDY